MQRRDFLRQVSTLTATSCLLPAAWGQSTPAGEALTFGLLFGNEDLPRIRQNFLRHPFFAEFRDELLAFDKKAEVAWMENDLRYNDQLFDIARLGQTAESMAFLFLMNGDAEAARLAIRAIEEILKFERWDFFLDGDVPISVQRASSSTQATALTADFLGARLSADDRRRWFRAMGQKGCEPCFRTLYGIRHPQTVTGWRFDPESTFFEHRPGNRTDMNRRPEITRDTNLRAVPAAALIIGTVAYQLEFGPSPETQRWTEMGRHALEAFREFFQPDGSYNEETGYANYTAVHIQQAAVALQRHTEIDLLDVIQWNAYVEFMANMSMPTHLDPYAVVNFGDSGNAPGNSRSKARTALPLWVAATQRNPFAQWFARNLAGTPNYWSTVWHDPTVEEAPPAPGPRLWVSDLDRVVARTGFGVEDLVVAMRSGPPSNHEHADRNGIIVKCYGEELVTDPLRPPYSYSDPSWRMRLTEGHSAVLIDGRGHEHHNGVEGTNASNAYARITRNESDATHALWVSESTQPYRLIDTDIKSVMRSVVVFFDQPAILIVDQLTKWATPSRLQSRFFGYNLDGELQQTVSANGFTVTRPHATLHAQVFSSHGHEILADRLDVAPERAQAHPYIDVRTPPAMGQTVVTVLLPVRPGEQPRAVTSRGNEESMEIIVNDRVVTVAPGVLEVS